MRGWLALVFVVACKSKEAAPPPPAPAPVPAPVPKPAKTLRQVTVEEDLVVVLPATADAASVAKAVAPQLALFGGKVEVMPAQEPTQQTLDEMARDDKDLSAADIRAIASNAGISMKATGEPVATLRALAAAALAVARERHGWVYDPVVNHGYTAAQFEKHVPRDPVDVEKQIDIHGVMGDNEQPFLDTLGMVKLGLPELRVSAVASGQLSSMATLINATAQAMLARDIDVPSTVDIDMATLPGEWHLDRIRARGGSGHVRWKVRWTTDPDSGDDEIELVPAAGSGAEGAYALLDDCLGKQPDHTTEHDKDDPELIAAAVKARAELQRRRPHYARGVPPGERLSVKAPFREAGTTEWMWVDVVSWKGDLFEGSLDNEPERVKNVKLGQTVRVKLADVADFIAHAADGSTSGGYSVEVLNRREGMR